MADESDLAALRAEYTEIAGKKPGPRWDVETLTAKIAEAKANPPAADPPPHAPKVKGVRIVITANHIYLPLDEDGNCLAWEGQERNTNTVRVERRTRLLVHPDMAKSLQDADRAETLG